MKSKLIYGLSAAAMMLAAGSSATAQDGVSTLEEVIVTAERTETNLQSTAVSVAAFSAETLKQQSVTQLTDLTRIVPGMRFQGQGNIATGDITVRGVNRAPTGTGGAVVVNYFNEVPLIGPGGSSGTYLSTFDLGSLQVLRGPQGTLFGKNTVGGAILIGSTPPTFDPSGYVSADYGNHDYWQLEGAVNVPIVEDKVALRLAGQVRQRDAYVENIGVGPDFNNIDTYTFRASLLLQPTERLRSTTVVDYINGDEVGWASIAYERNPNPSIYFGLPPALLPILRPAFEASAAEAVALGTRATNNNTPDPKFLREITGIFNTTTYEINDNLTAKGIFSYREVYQLFLINNDGLGASLFEIGSVANGRAVTAELQLVGSAFDDRLEWIFGGFYSRDKPNGLNGQTNTLGILNSPQYQDNRNKALFGNVRLNLTDQLTFSGGYRYSWDEQDFCKVNGNFNASECSALAAGPLASEVSSKEKAPTWKASIEYQATDDLFVYALVSRGYRFGGISSPFIASKNPCVTGAALGSYNIGGTVVTCSLDAGIAAGRAPTGRAIDLTQFQNLKNEIITNYEAGFRADANFGGWPQRLNVTVYHYIYENLVSALPLLGQVQPGTPGAPAFDTVGFNAGEVTATGVEADLTLRPVDALTLMANVAYTDQEQTEAGDPPPGFLGTIAPATLAAPKWSYTISGRLVLPFQPMEGELALNVSYFHTGTWQTQLTDVEGYGLWNARLDWNNIGGSKVSASIWGTNLSDEVYVASPVAVGPQLPAKVANIGEPRMYGVQLRYAW